MFDAAESQAEKTQRVLGELTELGLTLARDLHARALAAESAEEAQALGLAFHRISRSVRQSLALEARMQRDAKLAEREAWIAERQAEDRARQAHGARLRDHKGRVHVAMQRLIWTEAEGDEDEVEALEEDLSARLDEAALDEAFLEIPVEVLAARFTAEMNLAAGPASAADVRPDNHAAQNSS